MENFFTNIIVAIKSFFLSMWNILLSFLGKFLPDGIDLAFAIILVMALVLFIFRAILTKGSK